MSPHRGLGSNLRLLSITQLLAPGPRSALILGVGPGRLVGRHVRQWGFDLADITIPVLLPHGRQDMFVPFGHGEWLAAHIPDVEARLLDDDGHLTLLQNRVPEMHAWLSEHL